MKTAQATPHIDWTNLLTNLGPVLIRLVILAVIFWLCWHFGTKAIDRYFVKKNGQHASQRQLTIAKLAENCFRYLLIFLFFCLALSTLGVSVGGLLASAGIVSLALGLGAKDFVSDLISGFFILSENQFNVGDLVMIGTETGTVVELGLRTTKLRDASGSISYIPNRNIAIVKNITAGGVGVDIDLQLAGSNDFALVKKTLGQVNNDLGGQQLKQAPQLLGIIKQAGPDVLYRVHLQAQPGQQQVVRDQYTAAYLQALQAQHIKLSDLNIT
ncbi:MAG: mechanosensitive ion channel family protein [Lactobacillus sp.]